MKNINKKTTYKRKKKIIYIMKIYNKGYFRYSSNTIREVENIKHVYKAIQHIMFQEWLSKTKKGGWELVRNLIQMFFSLSLSSRLPPVLSNRSQSPVCVKGTPQLVLALRVRRLQIIFVNKYKVRGFSVL